MYDSIRTIPHASIRKQRAMKACNHAGDELGFGGRKPIGAAEILLELASEFPRAPRCDRPAIVSSSFLPDVPPASRAQLPPSVILFCPGTWRGTASYVVVRSTKTMKY
jgi:hypothetical protein